jgi:hypothetical protein
MKMAPSIPTLLQVVAAGLLAAFPIPLHAEIKHFSISDVTRFTACVENVLHKHVMLHPTLPLKEVVLLCTGQPQDVLVAAFKQHGVALREDGDWAYLLSASYFGPWPSYAPESDKLKWAHFQVEVSAHSVDPKYHQNEVELSVAQLSKLKEQVLAQARLVPVFEPHTQSPNEIAKIAFDLQVLVRRTRKDAAASIVVLLREADDFSVAGRIVYGEQQPDGSFKLVWDSPIVDARFPEVSFLDINGDGVEEIVLKAAYPAGMHDLEAITVFDIQGQELTRQSHCFVPDLYGYSQDDGSCPIVAESVDFDYSHGPPFDIDASTTVRNGKDAVFKLLNNRFVHPNPSPRVGKKVEIPSKK